MFKDAVSWRLRVKAVERVQREHGTTPVVYVGGVHTQVTAEWLNPSAFLCLEFSSQEPMSFSQYFMSDFFYRLSSYS